jgi:hypothetical protein
VRGGLEGGLRASASFRVDLRGGLRASARFKVDQEGGLRASATFRVGRRGGKRASTSFKVDLQSGKRAPASFKVDLQSGKRASASFKVDLQGGQHAQRSTQAQAGARKCASSAFKVDPRAARPVLASFRASPRDVPSPSGPCRSAPCRRRKASGAPRQGQTIQGSQRLRIQSAAVAPPPAGEATTSPFGPTPRFPPASAPPSLATRRSARPHVPGDPRPHPKETRGTPRRGRPDDSPGCKLGAMLVRVGRPGADKSCFRQALVPKVA